MIDKAFKIGLFLLGIIFLFLFYDYIQTNRYAPTAHEAFIIDKKTGKVYLIGGGSFDPVNKAQEKVLGTIEVPKEEGKTVTLIPITDEEADKLNLKGGNP